MDTRPTADNPNARPDATGAAWATLARTLLSSVGPQARKALRFVLACIALVGLVVGLIWAGSGFVSLSSIGLSGDVLVALTIGIIVSAGLGAGLMALVFHSDQDGRDEDVYRAFDSPAAPPPRDAPPGEGGTG